MRFTRPGARTDSAGGAASAPGMPPRPAPARSSLGAVAWAGVAVRVGAVPRPGAGDDLLQAGVARAPAELVANAVAGGDEHGGIPRAARSHLGRDGVPGDAAGGLQHLPHT